MGRSAGWEGRCFRVESLMSNNIESESLWECSFAPLRPNLGEPKNEALWVFPLFLSVIRVPWSGGTVGLGSVAKSCAPRSPPRLDACRLPVLWVLSPGLQSCSSRGWHIVPYGIYSPSSWDAAEPLLPFPPSHFPRPKALSNTEKHPGVTQDGCQIP